MHPYRFIQFSRFSLKIYIVSTHWKRLYEALQISTHKKHMFSWRKEKNINTLRIKKSAYLETCILISQSYCSHWELSKMSRWNPNNENFRIKRNCHCCQTLQSALKIKLLICRGLTKLAQKMSENNWNLSGDQR